MTFVFPKPLDEVIWVTPAMRPNWRSSGVATAEAMVSGLAPGNDAPTWITGNSTCGKGATGRKLNASAPAMSRAAASNDVPIGRLIHGAEIFMTQSAEAPPGSSIGLPIFRWEKRCANRSNQRYTTGVVYKVSNWLT